jgi:cystathionine beta-lyase
VANIHAADPAIRGKINRALNINEVCEINAFAIEALTAAYSEGAEWLDELIEYLHGNYLFLKDFFNRHLPHLPVLPLEATYLVWIDCRALNCPSAEITDMLLQNENLQVNPGTLYGAGGENFIRINIACPRTLLIEGLSRIKHALTR